MATITASEREHLLHHLRRTASDVCDALKGMHQAQWDFRAPEGGWSAGEIFEHIVHSEAVIFSRVHDVVLQSPPRPTDMEEAHRIDALLLARVPQRARKAPAPADMVPAHRYSTPSQALAAFQRFRARTMQYVESTSDDLRAHAAEHELLKTLDGYQWLLLVAVHTRRHLAQWAELKQHIAFPPAAEAFHA